MALTQVTGPYPIFTDLDGTPLDDGYLYIGAINQDPEQNPIQVFWDANLTIAATQPIRTSNGYAYRNGTPALLYTGGEFSITIRNKREEFVLYSPVGYGFDPAAVSASVVKNDFVGNGVQVDFVLSASPSTILATSVFINGVYQEKDSYTLAGNTITFSIAPPLNSSIEIMTNETGVINSGNATAISYTASFAGATAQTVQTKLEQYVSVKDFGAVGDGVTDDTVAIQAAINYASNSDVMTITFPGGTYNYDTIYCYYDAVNNPGFNVNRNGELLLTGDGIKPENGGSGGTTLYCTKATGNGFNVGVNDAMPYNTRDFMCRDISFGGDTTGFLVSALGVVSAKFENCQFVQENIAGGGLWITTAYFGVLEKCRFMNIGAGTKTGDAIKFGTTNFAGLFTLRDVNVSGYAKGLHFYAGDWQLLSIYDTELAGSEYGVYVSGGRIQTFNMYGCYFEGTCTSFIAVSAANRIQQFQLNGCWGYALNLTGPCIDLIQPNTVTITNVQIQDLRSAFLNINGVSSGGVPNYMCQGINFTQNGTAPSPITIFTGIVPALFGVEYNTGDANLTLCAAAERPLTYDPSAFTSSYFSAGHMLETKITDFGAVSGGSLDLEADGFTAMAWVYNVTSPTIIYLPAISTGMPNGFTATITSVDASTQNSPVKTAIADGAVTVATILPGQQRKFVFFNDGVSTGWK